MKSKIPVKCANDLCQILVVTPWPKNLHLETGTGSCQGSRSPLEVHPLILQNLRRRESWGMPFLMCCNFQLHYDHLYLFCRLVHFSNFLNQWRIIISLWFVFNMVQIHHLELRWWSLLFHNLYGLTVRLIKLIILSSRRGLVRY